MVYEPKQHQQNNDVSAASGAEYGQTESAPSTTFTSVGTIPPVGSTFEQHPAPSASDLAFGPGSTAPSAQTPAPARKAMNPTYVDARLYAGMYFRRQGELAHLLSQACRDGLQAFSIRSSEQYNKSDSMGFLLFKLALDAVPAGGALVQTLHELTTNQKLRELTGLVSALKKAAEGTEKVHQKIEKAEKVTERVKKGTEAIEKKNDIGEASEAKEKGDFELETVSTLGELLSDSVAARWQNEDQIDAMLQQLEYTDSSINLEQMIKKVLGAPPNPSAVKGLVSEAAQQFELLLYLQFYVEAGKATYVTEDWDGSIRSEFEGLPPGVVRRFEELGKTSLLVHHPKMKKRHTLRTWTGHQF